VVIALDPIVTALFPLADVELPIAIALLPVADAVVPPLGGATADGSVNRKYLLSNEIAVPDDVSLNSDDAAVPFTVYVGALPLVTTDVPPADVSVLVFDTCTFAPL
jgi:hypothetical protein